MISCARVVSSFSCFVATTQRGWSRRLTHVPNTTKDGTWRSEVPSATSTAAAKNNNHNRTGTGIATGPRSAVAVAVAAGDGDTIVGCRMRAGETGRPLTSNNAENAAVENNNTNTKRRRRGRGRRDAMIDGAWMVMLATTTTTTTMTAPLPAVAATNVADVVDYEQVEKIARLQSSAIDAFSRRDFPAAVVSLRELTRLEPDNPSWHEALGQCYTDDDELRQDFKAASEEFTAAIALTPVDDAQSRARLLAGRALAAEGAADWSAALADYDDALATAARGGLSADPYIINCRGNVLASSGDWDKAREAYLASAAAFQGVKGVNSVSVNKLREDGYTFAASNAALALAQLGETKGSVAEMEKISRRAPGNADVRAALAALYWSEGREEDAEREWEFACDRISVGCSKYKDKKWVTEVRRWPPKMVALLDAFINIR